MASHAQREDQEGNSRSNPGNPRSNRSRSGSDNWDQGLINLLLRRNPGLMRAMEDKSTREEQSTLATTLTIV